MNQTLKQRIFENKSIILRPPSPNAPHNNKCQCFMCNHFQKNKQLQLLSIQQSSYKQKMQSILTQSLISSNCNCNSQNFQWILNRLLIPTNKMINRGIQIFIPQTLFYKQGQPYSLYKNKQIDDPKIKKIKKDKINQTFIQKVMNQRRRKYREQILIANGQKIENKKQSTVFGKKQQKVDTKDAAIIQYTDGSQQLITQNQLINLLLKRKQDPIWKKIVLIKNFITAKDITNRMFKIQFKYNSHTYPQLFSRSKTLMRIYAGNILQDQKSFISQHQQQSFCLQLLSKSSKIFAQYTIYKIVSYIEYFYDQKIQKINCNIIINQINRPYLVDVFDLQTTQLVKYNWTDQTYKKKVQEQQKQIFMTDKQINVDILTSQVQHHSQIYEQNMYDKYQQQKQKYGLTNNPQDKTQQTANNKFFSFLYPDFKHDLSQVLKQQNLSILDFKKNYLGYTPQKKSIIRPFNSNFTNILHSLTPRVKLQKQDRSMDKQSMKNTKQILFYKTLSPIKQKNKSFRAKLVMQESKTINVTDKNMEAISDKKLSFMLNDYMNTINHNDKIINNNNHRRMFSINVKKNRSTINCT